MTDDNLITSSSPSSVSPQPSSSSGIPAEGASPSEDFISPSSPPFPIPVEGTPPPEDSVSPPPPPSFSPPPEAGDPAGPPAKIVEPIFKRLIPLVFGLGVIFLIFLLVTKVVLPMFNKPKIPDNITLKYWGLWEPENIMSQIINDYQTLNPNITIQYVRQSPKDYRERLQSSLAKNEGPDIFRWHNTWLPMLKNDLSPVPEDIYSANDFNTVFYPIVKKDAFSSGRYYGIPLEFDALALFVNQDIFLKDPSLKVPTTWDNLRQTAFKLKKTNTAGKLVLAGAALGNTSNVDNFSDILGLMILQNGGDPGQPESESVASALKFYTLFTTQDQSWNSELPPSTYAFATEKVAMIIAPSWRALEIKQINPQLNFKLYSVPQLPGTNIAWATYWLEGVSKKSSQSQAAWQFVKYLSSPEVLTKMYSLASQTRLFGEPYSRQDMASVLQQDPFVGAVVSQALSAQSWPLASRTFDNGLNDKIIKYYEDAVNGYNQNQDEKTIIQNLTQGVTQVLSQYGLSSQ